MFNPIPILRKEIQALLDQFAEFHLPPTQSSLVEQMQAFEANLNHAAFKVEDKNALYLALNKMRHLVQNLQLAKEAAEFVSARTIPTNSHPSSNDLANNQKLEEMRALMDTNLLKTFSKLKNVRDRLTHEDVRQTIHEQESINVKPSDFSQSTYEKGKGVSIAMWYRHIASKTKRQPRRIANCTEQSNSAFGYLYTIIVARLRENKQSPINRIERLDIANTEGGHCVLLMDRKLQPDMVSKIKYDVQWILNQPENFFGETCVVIDPWNIKTPFYLAADILKNMPECGTTGVLNIEFGLDFSEQKRDANLKLFDCNSSDWLVRKM